MSIDLNTLPLGAVVEVSRPDVPDDYRLAYKGLDSSMWTRRPGLDGSPRPGDVTRVFVPVPDGVAYEDALRAVEDARPWVPLPDGIRFGEYEGCRLRADGDDDKAISVSGPLEWEAGGTALVGGSRVHASRGWRWFIHPDDVPDPDADLIERMAKAMAVPTAPWDDWTDTAQDQWRNRARAALAVVRENEAQR